MKRSEAVVFIDMLKFFCSKNNVGLRLTVPNDQPTKAIIELTFEAER